ncbi:NAD-dependent epimerase/dehydratase family protein [Bacillus cereus]|uniref:NAD-dependent epimerase/dehydratase family protein n=1 Tax=Bacillus cereus TaxID=1396 RepID=UPI000279A9E6|nr:NAD-dependent epimerase/dehydratase family protein [Bacillus cereus]EJR73558.1 hypothetical protein IK9_05093 [Bacillus cereus VD166]MDA1913567.1 NAD-dependent epimerase/dehydratase family protein [Bacillus cereus]MDA2659687.1 NAD-dependent epimerase/dehydratase family protein [Bacillus cereus]MDZ4631603.1 NAD-dependent epimerase/dehydratase family protein [Bacillus cereus]
MANILVTGGAGFIGFHLVKHLLKIKHNVTVIDNFFRIKEDEEFKKYESSFRFIQGDLTKPLVNVLDNQSFDYVFHLAAINGVKYANEIPETVLRTNILSTINILDWCAENPPKSFVFASSSETYNGSKECFEMPIPTPENVPVAIKDVSLPRNSYACSKMTGELLTIHYANKYNFIGKVVRYHNIYGPRMGKDHVIPALIDRILNKENPFNLYGSEQTRAFCYITDAIEATYNVALLEDKEDYIVHIGNSDEEIDIKSLCNKIFEVARYEAGIKELSAPPGSPSRRCPSIEKLKTLTGYKPKVFLEEGLYETYTWYKEEYEKSLNTLQK